MPSNRFSSSDAASLRAMQTKSYSTLDQPCANGNNLNFKDLIIIAMEVEDLAELYTVVPCRVATEFALTGLLRIGQFDSDAVALAVRASSSL